MSTNLIDDMTEREAKSILNDVCCILGLGGKGRTKAAIISTAKATQIEYCKHNQWPCKACGTSHFKGCRCGVCR